MSHDDNNVFKFKLIKYDLRLQKSSIAKLSLPLTSLIFAAIIRCILNSKIICLFKFLRIMIFYDFYSVI